MSNTTKYTPAAQRDSLDEPANYTQPPPTYDDQPSASHDQDALLGAPRSSEDNIPDDFKVGGIHIIVIDTNSLQVWRICCGGDSRYSYAVCQKGLFYSVR